MSEKVGRNDPCPCGSGKKYKNCCFIKEKQAKAPVSLHKLKAKVISGGGMMNQQPTQNSESMVVDYNVLMEQAFGHSLQAYQDKPPLPQDPSQYLVKEDGQS
jgi:hypothetical protein